MRTAKLGDARKLFVPCRLEIDVVRLNAKTALAKKAIRRHPRAGGFVQIHAVRIEVPILGLVADNHDRNVLALA